MKNSVVVKNKISGLNFADIYQLQGKFPLPESGVLGLEGAGEVVEVGEGVTQFKVGDRVFAVGQSSHAEYSLLTDLDIRVSEIPDSISYEAAAALFVQAITAITLIEESYKVQKGEYVLVHAVAGGVGSLLAQLLNEKGAIVIGTTSSKEKAEFAKKNGAHHVINYKEENFVERVLEITEGKGVHLALDSVGGAGFADSIKSLRTNGTVISFGSAAGPIPPLEVNSLFGKNVHVGGVSVYGYISTPADFQKWTNRFFELVAKNQLKYTLYKTYTFDELPQAFEDLASGKTFGKLLLTL